MKRRVLVLAAAAILVAAAAALYAWQAGCFLPRWIDWRQTALTGPASERIVLAGRQVCVSGAGAVLWRSGRELRVQDALVCDIDRDGQSELLLLCWKRGRYGASRPFWVTRDEMGWSQHIFIYKLTAGGVRPVWMASEIGLEAASWRFDETERLVITDRNGAQSAWDWVSWGLSRIGPATACAPASPVPSAFSGGAYV